MAALIGGAGESCPAYHNIMGEDGTALLKDAEAALSQGFRALKDHLSHDPAENIRIFRELRKSVGEEVTLMHDAALANYDFVEAYEVGKVLEELKFLFYEEPLPDRQLDDYLRLAGKLAIPLAGPETFMHDADLSALWLKMGAVKVLRGKRAPRTDSGAQAVPFREIAAHPRRAEHDRSTLWPGARPYCLRRGQHPYV